MHFSNGARRDQLFKVSLNPHACESVYDEGCSRSGHGFHRAVVLKQSAIMHTMLGSAVVGLSEIG